MDTLNEDLCTFMIMSRSLLLRMRNVSDKSCREKENIHILCSITFFFWKLCLLWDNVEKYGTARQATDDSIIQRICFACWIPKSTNTLRICNTHCIFTAKMVRPKNLSASMLCYTYIAYRLSYCLRTTVSVEHKHIWLCIMCFLFVILQWVFELYLVIKPQMWPK